MKDVLVREFFSFLVQDKALDELQKVIAFCANFSCRRKQLLKYFQEEVTVRCTI